MGLVDASLSRTLSIEGNEEKRLESFPEEWLLLSTVTSLAIKGFPILKSVDGKGIQHVSVELGW